MIENSVIFISAYIIALVCNNIFFVLFLFSHKMKLLPFSESIIFWLFLHLIFGNNLCGWESFSSIHNFFDFFFIWFLDTICVDGSLLVNGNMDKNSSTSSFRNCFDMFFVSWNYWLSIERIIWDPIFFWYSKELWKKRSKNTKKIWGLQISYLFRIHNFLTFSSIYLSLDENSSSSVTKVGEWSRFLWICKKSRIFVHISINQKNQKNTICVDGVFKWLQSHPLHTRSFQTSPFNINSNICKLKWYWMDLLNVFC